MACAKRIPSIVILLGLAVLLGGCSTLGLFVPQGSPNVARASSLDAVQAQVSFHIPRAGWLPFQSGPPIAFLETLPPGVHRVEVVYASQNESVTFTIMDRPTALGSVRSDMYELIPVKLRSGMEGTYMDNGTSQILNWTDGRMSYQVTASSKSGAFQPEDLVKIADNLE